MTVITTTQCLSDLVLRVCDISMSICEEIRRDYHKRRAFTTRYERWIKYPFVYSYRTFDCKRYWLKILLTEIIFVIILDISNINIFQNSIIFNPKCDMNRNLIWLNFVCMCVCPEFSECNVVTRTIIRLVIYKVRYTWCSILIFTFKCTVVNIFTYRHFHTKMGWYDSCINDNVKMKARVSMFYLRVFRLV